MEHNIDLKGQRRIKNMKKLDKDKQPSKSDIDAANKAFAEQASGEVTPFAAFGEIDTIKEGVEVGLMNTVKFHFEKFGDRLVGYLKCRRLIESGDAFMVYEVYNTDGDHSFSGGKLVEGRMKEIPDGSIVDITYTDNKMSAKRKKWYKNFKIKFYPWPEGVDPYAIRVKLSDDGNKIIPVDFPSDLGATPFADETEEEATDKGE